jgi:hypothetical protein
VKDEFLYEITSKRRKGFPPETNVKRGFPRCARHPTRPFEVPAAKFRPLELTQQQLLTESRIAIIMLGLAGRYSRGPDYLRAL